MKCGAGVKQAAYTAVDKSASEVTHKLDILRYPQLRQHIEARVVHSAT